MLKLTQDPAKRFYFLLGGITLAGLLFRVKSLGTESITADEVSALLRLQFPSFSEMINGGVRPDGHPAFTQVLLWCWTKLFGLSEFSVRLPFALFGGASIWLAGMIAKKWFGEYTAFATAAGMAFLEFPLMYSQLARPYAPGLFFTLLAAWYLTAFLQNEKARKGAIIGFAFAAALAAYSHYFSLLAAALMGVFGIFLVAKQNRVSFLIACAGAIVLFLSHVGLTLDQLKVGGIGGPGGWLGKPTPDFLPKHFVFIFNGSLLIALAAIGLWIGTAIVFLKRPGKFHLLAFLLWVLPLVIGYVYSVQRNPVLQDSVLLFGFPFLLMFLFAWLPNMADNKFAPVLPMGVTLALLFYAGSYRLTDHFGRLKELVEISTEWQQRFGAENVTVAYNVDAPYFVQYYYDQSGKKQTNVVATINNGELLDFRRLVEKSSGDYFVYSWSTKYSPVEIPEIIRETYPYVVQKNEWFNSATYVFARSLKDGNGKISDEELFYARNDFSPGSDYSMTVTNSNGKAAPAVNWSEPCGLQAPDSSALKKDSVQSPYVYTWSAGPNYNVRLDSACVYSPSLTLKVSDVLPNPDNIVLLTARIKLLDKNAAGVLVVEFIRNGKSLYWNGRETNVQTDSTNTDWQRIYYGLQLPGDLRASDTVKVYCYTKGGAILLDYFEVRTLGGHHGIYGLRENYE